MANATLHKFSVKDYYRMAEIGVLRPDARVELLDGIIIDNSPVSPLHAGVVRRLNRFFHEYSRDPWLLSVRHPVHLDDFSEAEPDVMLVSPAPDFYTSRHPKPADVFLLIEVSDSTVETDREVKLPIYARAGIVEVWIVNLTDGSIEVYREPHDAGYASTQILREGDSIAPALFTDAVIDVAQLLRH
ncbi:MAG TPA: Uma2 family endonuclease [Verrucomicrobiae bacterium]|jgi:Uma2 family endonuclease|nr:Uma2 family endonuclease [Verrucomicrobiae bacterium]